MRIKTPQGNPGTTTTSSSSNSTTKKKHKGHKPAHQNTYAFKHNPKSKLTESILNSPIEHCCYRCTDKIIWRKKYRKYKPLTVQPSMCNICHNRNVMSAYHTVCTNCSMYSEKAQTLLHQWNTTTTTTTTTDNTTSAENPAETSVVNQPMSTSMTSNDKEATSSQKQEIEDAEVQTHNNNNEEKSNNDDDDDDDSGYIAPKVDVNVNTSSSSSSTSTTTVIKHRRVCTICFKAPALPSPDDEKNDNDDAMLKGKLKLRQLKTIQRNKIREITDKKKNKKENRLLAKETLAATTSQEQQQHANNSSNDITLEKLRVNDSSDDNDDTDSDDNNTDDNDDDVNDPFLQAVGGKDKLLTGDAYQQMLLSRKK